MSADHLGDERPKARRDHVCFCCGQTIPKGEVYVVRTNAMDREVYRTRMHAECEAATRKWIHEWEDFEPGSLERGKQ